MDLSDALKLMAQIKDIIPIKLEKLSSSFLDLQVSSQEFIKNTIFIKINTFNFSNIL